MNTLDCGPELTMRADPLHAFTPLPFRAEYYPDGFPVSIASNSSLVLDAARESWAGFPKRFHRRPIELRCLVEGNGAAHCPPPPVVRAQGHLLSGVADSENFSCCDLARGFAFASVTKAVVQNAEYFRYHFLESMATCLLDTLHLVAVHAACVTFEGHGVLLAGDSGAGKSSLAYACARRGWVYTSDDATSLVLRGRNRKVTGNPRSFRFRASAGEIFPEFRGMRETRRGHGKPTIEVRSASLPELRTASQTHVDYVVFLNRNDAISGRVQLFPVSREVAFERLFLTLWPPELKIDGTRRAAVERLLDADVYEMSYRELDAAVDELERMIHGGTA
jgi:hypothetical protein